MPATLAIRGQLEVEVLFGRLGFNLGKSREDVEGACGAALTLLP